MTLLACVFLFLVNAQSNESFSMFLLRLKLLPVDQRPAAVTEYLKSAREIPVMEGRSSANFVWFGKAKTVLVSGDLQRGWSVQDTMIRIPCGEDSFFYRSYTLPPDARLDYQFIIDGTWSPDALNPRTTPSGYGVHSELAMPGFSRNPNLQQNPHAPRGSLDSLIWKSREDSIRQRLVWIYKPAGYDSLKELPTLYVHDGRDALDFALFRTVLDNLIALHKIEAIVAVFIPPVQREYEYVGLKQRMYTRVLCDELVPLIDERFRTSRRAEDRAMMGISNGGHLSIATVLKRPDVFLNGAGQSSTITPQLLEVLDNAITNVSSHRPFRLYLDVGEYDLDYPGADASFLAANRMFSAELKKAGIGHTFHIFNDGHEWANWRERTEEILVLFFGAK